MTKKIRVDDDEFEGGYFDKTLIAGFIVDTNGYIVRERMISTSGFKRLDKEFLNFLSESKWKSGFCAKVHVDT